MYFGFGNRTILKSHRCDTLQFSPTSRAKVLLEIYEIADSVTNGDRSDVADLTDDFERFLRHVRNLSRFTLWDKTRLCSHLSASVRALRRCENGAVLQYDELARADRDVHVAHVTVGVRNVAELEHPLFGLSRQSRPSVPQRRECRFNGDSPFEEHSPAFNHQRGVSIQRRHSVRGTLPAMESSEGSVDSMAALCSRNTPRRSLITRECRFNGDTRFEEHSPVLNHHEGVMIQHSHRQIITRRG